MMKKARLIRFGHVRGKGAGYIRNRMLRVELPGKMKTGRPKEEVYECDDGGEIKMVWTRAKERCWVYQEHAEC